MNRIYLFSLSVLFSLLLFSCSRQEESVSPSRRTITEAVYASGTVVPFDEYTVTSTVTGRIQRQFVREGDFVKTGQVLMLLENDVQSANAKTAEAQLDLARRNAAAGSPVLGELKQAIDVAEAKYRLDYDNYIRYKNLVAQQSVTKAAFDQAEAQYLISKNTLEQARERYKIQKNQVETGLRTAESQYQAQLGTKNDFEIRSAINGKVYTIYRKLGELVGPQQQIMTLGNASTFRAEVFVDEADIARITEGQKAALKLENYGDRVFMGTVIKIYPQINPVNRSFKVDVTFDELPPRVYAGVSVEANIIIAQRENALVLPKAYVFGGDSVLVEHDGSEQVRKVRTGVEDLEYVEIVSGLSPGARVLKNKQ